MRVVRRLSPERKRQALRLAHPAGAAAVTGPVGFEEDSGQQASSAPKPASPGVALAELQGAGGRLPAGLPSARPGADAAADPAWSQAVAVLRGCGCPSVRGETCCRALAPE